MRQPEQVREGAALHRARDSIGALRGVEDTHTVEYRASVRLPIFNRVTFIVATGKDRRSNERPMSGGHGHPAWPALLQSAIAGTFLCCAAFGAFCLAYIVKCLLGVNLFPGQSPLHPLYALLWP